MRLSKYINSMVIAIGLAALLGTATLPARTSRSFLIVGDSVSGGSFGRVPESDAVNNGGWSEFFYRNHTVIPENAQTSRYTLRHIDELLEPADTVLWNNGIWDVVFDVPLDEYRANLYCIGTRLQWFGTEVYFITTTPISPDLKPGMVEKYNAVAVEVMASLGIPVIDMNAFCEGKDDMRVDALHWNRKMRKMQGHFVRSHF